MFLAGIQSLLFPAVLAWMPAFGGMTSFSQKPKGQT